MFLFREHAAKAGQIVRVKAYLAEDPRVGERRAPIPSEGIVGLAHVRDAGERAVLARVAPHIELFHAPLRIAQRGGKTHFKTVFPFPQRSLRVEPPHTVEVIRPAEENAVQVYRAERIEAGKAQFGVLFGERGGVRRKFGGEHGFGIKIRLRLPLVRTAVQLFGQTVSAQERKNRARHDAAELPSVYLYLPLT